MRADVRMSLFAGKCDESLVDVRWPAFFRLCFCLLCTQHSIRCMLIRRPYNQRWLGNHNYDTFDSFLASFIRTPLPKALNRFKCGNTVPTPSIPCTRSMLFVSFFPSLSWRYYYHVVDTLALDRIYYWHDFTYTTCLNVAHSNDGFVTFASFSKDSCCEPNFKQFFLLSFHRMVGIVAIRPLNIWVL